VTPEIIHPFTKQASSSTLMDTLKNIVLVAGPLNYEKFKPERMATFKKRFKRSQQVLIGYCEEVVKFLHTSFHGMHPWKEEVLRNFKNKLALRFRSLNRKKPYGT